MSQAPSEVEETMEKLLLRPSPLLASSLAFAPSTSFRIYSCQKQRRRLLSGVDSSKAEVKKRQGMYPGVPLVELIRGWFLYNLFRSNYLVDNGLKVRIFLSLTLCPE